MFDPIIERLFDYKNVISKSLSGYYKIAISSILSFNLLVGLVLKKIKYQFELRWDYYLLGKYLAKIDNQKYNLSQDKTFIVFIEKIKIKKNEIIENEKNLNSIFNK
tara:strand:- start:309 stop:626 length:318 start_codon:yes stop_codon:yes gene_type:complete